MTIRRTGAVLLTALLAGCGLFSRPKNTFYSLQTIPATAPTATAPPAVVTGAPVGIDSVELPPGLDRRDLFVRGAEHKVDVRGTNQWTAPLHEMVVHTLAFDLNCFPKRILCRTYPEPRALNRIFSEPARRTRGA